MKCPQNSKLFGKLCVGEIHSYSLALPPKIQRGSAHREPGNKASPECVDGLFLSLYPPETRCEGNGRNPGRINLVLHEQAVILLLWL